MAVGRIVTTTYRYKPPPQKREALATAGPAVVRKAKPGNDTGPEAEHLPTAGKRPTIVATRRREKRNADVPEMTPEEHQRRGDAADALFRELVRRATGPEPTPSSGQEATNVDDPSSRRREARVYLEAWSGVHHRAR